MRGLSYKKYLRISANQIIEKRKRCVHVAKEDIVYYKRCQDCGEFIPFRTEEDILRRGIIPFFDPYI